MNGKKAKRLRREALQVEGAPVAMGEVMQATTRYKYGLVDDHGIRRSGTLKMQPCPRKQYKDLKAAQ